MIRGPWSVIIGAWMVAFGAAPVWAAGFEREPMVMRVVAVNPSSEKTQPVPVRIDLPIEVGPAQILDQGGLDLDYDTERSIYFVYTNDLMLAPKETTVFEVLVQDVWFLPLSELNGLRTHTGLVLGRLEGTEYFDSAKQLGDSILRRLDAIGAVQSDETISRRKRIGAYRKNLLVMDGIKEDLARMEKLLSFTGGPPIPEMLEESPLKSDAPSTTTTWLVIFLIVIFMGLLAGQFFFTWQRRLQATGGTLAESSQGQGSAEPAPSETHAGHST